MTIRYTRSYDRVKNGQLEDVSDYWSDHSGNRVSPTSKQKDHWAYQQIISFRKRSEFELHPNSKCPQCGDPVYFMRHRYNGGCAWFDTVPPESGWEKHPCMDIPYSKCESGNEKLLENGELQRDPADHPRKPIWMMTATHRIYSSHKDEASKPPRDIDFALYGLVGPLKTMKRLSAYQLTLPSVERQKLRSMYAMGRPHRDIKHIVKWCNNTGSSLYNFHERGLGHLVAIPLTLLRSIRRNNKNYIVARSFLFPDIGLWFEVESGLRHWRKLHGLLHWNRDDVSGKQITFINPDTARLNWREITNVSGAFSDKPCLDSNRLLEETRRARQVRVKFRRPLILQKSAADKNSEGK